MVVDGVVLAVCIFVVWLICVFSEVLSPASGVSSASYSVIPSGTCSFYYGKLLPLCFWEKFWNFPFDKTFFYVLLCCLSLCFPL